MRHPELLLPAGSLPVLKIAVLYGADAVYIGGEVMSLRAKAKNFSSEEMREGIEFAHSHGKKVYVTANIYAHDADLDDAARYFDELRELGPDGVLVSDPGMFDLAKTHCPDIDIHISTQANTTNASSAMFWHRMGATRIVTARELSLAEITAMKSKIPPSLEVECFVHGAMCISYSGRCLLSSYLTGRDANRGACTHPCRWRYSVVEETRPGEYMPIEENERGTYIFNSRDLCMVDHLPDLYRAGIDSFKIEGRMKTALYVATAASVYSRAMRDFETDPALYESNIPLYREQISEGTFRRFTTGFFYGRPDQDALIYDSNTYVKSCTFLGIAEEADGDGSCRFRQKNKFSKGEEIEVMRPDGSVSAARVLAIKDEEGTEMESAPHPLQPLTVYLDTDVSPYDILRRRERI
ncbi:MAG: U32 family peptidase [Lachnospiraceae bacterium]|nr:U32 family peptidase [Lachnospiraceae bacterium]